MSALRNDEQLFNGGSPGAFEYHNLFVLNPPQKFRSDQWAALPAECAADPPIPVEIKVLDVVFMDEFQRLTLYSNRFPTRMSGCVGSTPVQRKNN